MQLQKRKQPTEQTTHYPPGKAYSVGMCIVIETTRREVHNSGPMFTYYIVQCVSVPSVWRDGERSDDESLYR